MSESGSKDVDAYIAAAPKQAQAKMRQLRKIVKANAPGATERLSYRMPSYDLHGRLVYFGFHANHVGLYALGQTSELAREGLSRYVASKGTLQFPFDEPLPEAEIAKLIRRRVAENEKAAASKSKR